MPRPNILYIHSHDTGRLIQPFGRAVPTPNLQRLAEQGVFFRRAFCAAPVCSASRSALLTGLPPHSAGMIGLAHRGFRLSEPRQHLASFLAENGYRTILAGEQHEASRAEVGALGYQEILPVASGIAPDVAPVAIGFLSRPHAGPFFLSVGFNDTHREFPPPDPRDDPRYLTVPAPLPDLPEVRQDLAGFYASARRLDAGLGAVMQALEDNHLAENTLVISTTDHGPAFPCMKCTLTDHGLGVYLILRGPGGLNGGRVVEAMVSHLDIYPTLCELLELPLPGWLRRLDIPGGGGGRSLLALLNSVEASGLHSELFGEVTYHAAYEPQRSVRTERWKYIRRFDGRIRRVLPNCDDSPSKTAWLERGWAEIPVSEEQLYDLDFDPNEACNRAADPACARVLADLRARLARWMEITADPLLSGAVSAPAGALANDPDDVSPQTPPRPIA